MRILTFFIYVLFICKNKIHSSHLSEKCLGRICLRESEEGDSEEGKPWMQQQS